MDKKIWKAIMDKLKGKGITVKERIIQDATFITFDSGHRKHRRDEVNTMDFLYSEAKSAEGNKEENVDKDLKKRMKNSVKMRLRGDRKMERGQ